MFLFVPKWAGVLLVGWLVRSRERREERDSLQNYRKDDDDDKETGGFLLICRFPKPSFFFFFFFAVRTQLPNTEFLHMQTIIFIRSFDSFFCAVVFVCLSRRLISCFGKGNSTHEDGMCVQRVTEANESSSSVVRLDFVPYVGV